MLRVTETQEMVYSGSFKKGFGFEIRKRGLGPHASGDVPILQLIYGSAAEAKEAEKAIRDAIGNPVDAQGNFSDAS
jgi:hypothetical protein